MPEPSLSITAEDGRPASHHPARAGRAGSRSAREGSGGADRHRPRSERSGGDFRLPAPAATVTAFDVPFGKLMMFFIKAVFAAIPALLLLTPALAVRPGPAVGVPAAAQMKILIYAPQEA